MTFVISSFFFFFFVFVVVVVVHSLSQQQTPNKNSKSQQSDRTAPKVYEPNGRHSRTTTSSAVRSSFLENFYLKRELETDTGHVLEKWEHFHTFFRSVFFLSIFGVEKTLRLGPAKKWNEDDSFFSLSIKCNLYENGEWQSPSIIIITSVRAERLLFMNPNKWIVFIHHARQLNANSSQLLVRL